MGSYRQRTQGERAAPVRRLARALALGALFAALALVAAYGVSLYGHTSGRSDAQIAHRQDVAVRTAVDSAVAAKGAADHLKRLRIVERHVAAQREQDMRLMERMLLAEQKAGDRRAEAAFERGRSVAPAKARVRTRAGGAAAPSR